MRGYSYEEIKAECGRHDLDLTDQQIRRCLKATARGYKWETESEGGRCTYLCKMDEESLAGMIRQCCGNLESVPIWVVLNEAHEMKEQRVANARTLLYKMNGLKLTAGTEDPQENSMYIGTMEEVSWLAEIQDLVDLDGQLCLLDLDVILRPTVTGRLLTAPEQLTV